MENWVDLDLELIKKTNGDINEFTGLNAVKSSLNNIFETMQGGRRMIPEFAVGLYYLLFEPLDQATAAEIGESLLDTAEKWDSRVIIENINVYPNADKNWYEVTLRFKLKNSNQIQEITQILRRM